MHEVPADAQDVDKVQNRCAHQQVCNAGLGAKPRWAQARAIGPQGPAAQHEEWNIESIREGEVTKVAETMAPCSSRRRLSHRSVGSQKAVVAHAENLICGKQGSAEAKIPSQAFHPRWVASSKSPTRPP